MNGGKRWRSEQSLWLGREAFADERRQTALARVRLQVARARREQQQWQSGMAGVLSAMRDAS